MHYLQFLITVLIVNRSSWCSGKCQLQRRRHCTLRQRVVQWVFRRRVSLPSKSWENSIADICLTDKKEKEGEEEVMVVVVVEEEEEEEEEDDKPTVDCSPSSAH